MPKPTETPDFAAVFLCPNCGYSAVEKKGNPLCPRCRTPLIIKYVLRK